MHLKSLSWHCKWYFIVIISVLKVPSIKFHWFQQSNHQGNGIQSFVILTRKSCLKKSNRTRTGTICHHFFMEKIIIICTMCWIKLCCHPAGRQNLRRSFLSYSSIGLSQSGHFNHFLFFVRTMGKLNKYIQPPSQVIELEALFIVCSRHKQDFIISQAVNRDAS